MSQLSFSDIEFTQKRYKTRKEQFLERMEKLVPWSRMESVIEPHYPKPGRGRRPYALSSLLRIHLLQQWYNLSDLAAEDALYEMSSLRIFAGLSIETGIPDRTTIMNFRHLLERHGLARQILEEINRWLSDAGVLLKEGTLMDATIIDAPSSTKNKSRERDPEMHQTRKGNQWYFGMKAHIGVDAVTGLTHSLSTTAANEHDLNQAENLLHGKEGFVFADAGYQGAEKRSELESKSINWYIAERPGKVRQWKERPQRNKLAIQLERLKAGVRARVEHPFRIIKCQFGFRKARYRGLHKNDNQLAMLFGLANLVRLDQMIRAQG